MEPTRLVGIRDRLLPMSCPSCGSAHQPGQTLDIAGDPEDQENPCAGSPRAVAAGVSKPAQNRASYVASLERRFERVLWDSRLIVLVAVAASLLVGVGMFFLATVDAVFLMSDIGAYLNRATAEAREIQRSQTVGKVVEVIDGYLLATIMLIFAFGLYELFIGRIDAARGSELSSRLLLIRSLDDLKDRLAKVVLLILVVKFSEHALNMSLTPTDLLYLAGGIVLVAAAVYLSHKKSGHLQSSDDREGKHESLQ